MWGRAVVARWAHDPETIGPNPTPATRKASKITFRVILPFLFLPPSPHMPLVKYFELWYYRS
jgi:hypothetical protein